MDETHTGESFPFRRFKVCVRSSEVVSTVLGRYATMNGNTSGARFHGPKVVSNDTESVSCSRVPTPCMCAALSTDMS